MIEVRALQKSFGDQRVLHDVAFDVPTAALCGFIGPNGAGKTTTMRILSTLEEPTSGSVLVHGVDVLRDVQAARRMIGYMPDYYGTYANLIVSEYLDFFARANRLHGPARSARTRDIVEFTELGPLLRSPVEGLSKGQKQRLSLARALLADPQVMILDEPAAGLDPRARIELRELLKVLAARGKTIFVSSHILSELADFIDWVVIIDHGRIRYAGKPALAAGQSASPAIFYALELASDELAARKFLLEQKAVSEVSGDGTSLRFALDETQDCIEELVARMVTSGVRFRQLHRQKTDLEDVFMQVTQKEGG